jgi:NADH dehydrogenase
VGVLAGGRVRVSGTLAWLAWLAIHIVFLIGFRNRVLVLFQWAWSYVTFRRGARLITGPSATGSSATGSSAPGSSAPERRVYQNR